MYTLFLLAALSGVGETAPPKVSAGCVGATSCHGGVLVTKTKTRTRVVRASCHGVAAGSGCTGVKASSCSGSVGKVASCAGAKVGGSCNGSRGLLSPFARSYRSTTVTVSAVPVPSKAATPVLPDVKK